MIETFLLLGALSPFSYELSFIEESWFVHYFTVKSLVVKKYFLAICMEVEFHT